MSRVYKHRCRRLSEAQVSTCGPMVEDEGGGLFGGQDGPCVCVYLHCSGRCKHAVGPSRGVGWMEGMRCGRVCACSY